MRFGREKIQVSANVIPGTSVALRVSARRIAPIAKEPS
jgi:hypothetical protein